MKSVTPKQGVLLRWVDGFIPWRQGADIDELFRARLVVGISAIEGALAAVYVALSATDSRLSHGIASFAALCAVVFASNIALVRYRTNARAASVVFSVELIVTLPVAAALANGYQTYLSGWMVWYVLIIIFLLGIKAGMWSALVLVVQGGAFLALERWRIYVPPGAHEANEAGEVIGNVVLLALVLCLAWVYERAQVARQTLLAAGIDELRRAQEDVSRTQDKVVAQEKLSTLGLLAQGIAHEINNPMAFITSNINSFQRDLARLREDPALMGEYERDVLPATLEGAKRVNAIVADLRKFSRYEAEKECVPYNLNEEITSALRIAQSQITEHDCCVETDLGQIPGALGYPRQLLQMLVNLVVNAVRAGGSGGMVRVSSWCTTDQLAIRVENATQDRAEGGGLELSQGIVAAHGGRIEVDSRGGRDSFTVWLPKAPAVRLDA